MARLCVAACFSVQSFCHCGKMAPANSTNNFVLCKDKAFAERWMFSCTLATSLSVVGILWEGEGPVLFVSLCPPILPPQSTAFSFLRPLQENISIVLLHVVRVKLVLPLEIR